MHVQRQASCIVGMVQDLYGTMEELRTIMPGLSLDDNDPVWEDVWPLDPSDAINRVIAKVKSYNMEDHVCIHNPGWAQAS